MKKLHKNERKSKMILVRVSPDMWKKIKKHNINTAKECREKLKDLIGRFEELERYAVNR